MISFRELLELGKTIHIGGAEFETEVMSGSVKNKIETTMDKAFATQDFSNINSGIGFLQDKFEKISTTILNKEFRKLENTKLKGKSGTVNFSMGNSKSKDFDIRADGFIIRPYSNKELHLSWHPNSSGRITVQGSLK